MHADDVASNMCQDKTPGLNMGVDDMVLPEDDEGVQHHRHGGQPQAAAPARRLHHALRAAPVRGREHARVPLAHPLRRASQGQPVPVQLDLTRKHLRWISRH